MPARFPAAIALFAVVVLLAPLAQAALPFPPEKERWVSLRADEFEIFSNASDAKTVDIATELLRMRDALGKLTRLSVRSPLPTRVFIFNNERTFAPYRDALFRRKMAAVTGLFMGGEDGNAILINADSGEGVDRVIFHELTHYFSKNSFRGLPLWFSEGLAEYYSTFHTSGDEVSLGRPVAEHVHWLRAQSLIPLRELFATTEESPTYNEAVRSGVYYAQSWALVHYLLRSSDERRTQLGTFLDLLDQGKQLDDAFATAFKMTYDQLERELQAYVRRFSFAYTRYSLADVPTRELPKPEVLTRDRVLAELGHMLAHSSADNLEEAERFLVEAIRLNPELASAHGNLARIYDISNRRAEAERAYEKAVQLGSGDAQVYLMYGDTILERIYREGTQNTARAEVLKARKLLEKAVQLDPKSARGWAGLGATYVATQDDAEIGIAALQKSLTLARGQEDVAYNLVLLYAQNGRRDEAAKLVDTVIARKGDPKLLAQAREAVLFADVRRIEALLREDKREEAVPLINAVLAQTTDDALKTHLNALLQHVVSVDAAQNAFDKLERASKLASERKFAEALKLIDEAIPLIDDANVAKQAKDFRAQVAGAAAKTKKK